jgi:ribonuclease HI
MDTSPENICKVNSDGSFDPDKRSGGWGFVVRNMNGEILAAGAGNIQHASSALHAEAIVAYKSIIHAAQLCRKSF